MRPRKLTKRLTLVTGMALAISLAAPQAAHATSYEEKFLTFLVNHYDRSPRGLRPLALNEFASKIARSHSYQMARANRIYHSDLRAIGTRISGWRVLGENVGVGANLRLINQAFMKSALHRANLLCRCFSKIGVGVVKSRGAFWVTLIFYG